MAGQLNVWPRVVGPKPTTAWGIVVHGEHSAAASHRRPAGMRTIEASGIATLPRPDRPFSVGYHRRAMEAQVHVITHA